MNRDRLVKRLAEAGERRTKAMDAKRDASEDIAALIPAAYRAGVGVSEMARLTGMSSRGIYDVLQRSGTDLPPSGRQRS